MIQNGMKGIRSVCKDAMLRKISLCTCITLFSGLTLPMPVMASSSVAVTQQSQKKISGLVLDATGAPIIGANVL